MVRGQEDKDDIENNVGKNEGKCEKIMLKCKKKVLVSDTTSDLLASNLETNLNLYRGIAYILNVLDTVIF